MVILGDSLVELAKMESNSVDSIVTDPPYGLKFMGKHWDYDVPSVGLWSEALRVLKPGGHLLAFAGTRTYHRMACNIEDAGFEIRDQIMWLYGSGFPKSLDVSKAIDKAAGAEREVVGYGKLNPRDKKTYEPKASNDIFDRNKGLKKLEITAPATPEAKQWQGWGTALKPANEPIVLARKPLEKGLTVAENVLKWGVGGLNIDGCRIGTDKIKVTVNDNMQGGNYGANKPGKTIARTEHQGRWPANVILDEVTGCAEWSRFFYVAKASKRERNAGLEGIPKKRPTDGRATGLSSGMPEKAQALKQNFHPTVKPIKLMSYLCRLVTPPTGTILDPFMGSGSTGVAALTEGFNFIGIERDREYIAIAKRRIEHATKK